ncbi:MAG: GNAT family N-acetyltransferase [Burkholderiales bacterium]
MSETQQVNRGTSTSSATEFARHALDWLQTHAAPLNIGSVLYAPEHAYRFAPLAQRFGLEAQPDGGWLKLRQPRWQLSWWPSSHWSSSWADLFEACFGHRMEEAHWRWKYGSSPVAGVGVHNLEGRLVAFYGAMARRVLCQGQPALMAQVGDVMVAPAERGLLTKQGPFMLAAATFIEQMMGQDRPYLHAFGFPNPRAMQVAQRLGLYKAVDEVLELSWSVGPQKIPFAYQVRPLRHTDESAVQRCWADMAASLSSSVLGVRDWAQVRQRYLEHPLIHYHALLLGSRWWPRPIGVVILRDHAEAGLEWMDFIAAKEHLPLLLKVALNHAQQLGRQRLFAWATASHLTLFDHHDVQTRSMDVCVPGSCWPHGPSAEAYRNAWFLMGGDTDFR